MFEDDDGDGIGSSRQVETIVMMWFWLIAADETLALMTREWGSFSRGASGDAQGEQAWALQEAAFSHGVVGRGIS